MAQDIMYGTLPHLSADTVAQNKDLQEGAGDLGRKSIASTSLVAKILSGDGAVWRGLNQ
jgi:hypothetical protein